MKKFLGWMIILNILPILLLLAQIFFFPNDFSVLNTIHINNNIYIDAYLMGWVMNIFIAVVIFMITLAALCIHG